MDRLDSHEALLDSIDNYRHWPAGEPAIKVVRHRDVSASNRREPDPVTRRDGALCLKNSYVSWQ